MRIKIKSTELCHFWRGNEQTNLLEHTIKCQQLHHCNDFIYFAMLRDPIAIVLWHGTITAVDDDESPRGKGWENLFWSLSTDVETQNINLHFPHCEHCESGVFFCLAVMLCERWQLSSDKSHHDCLLVRRPSKRYISRLNRHQLFIFVMFFSTFVAVVTEDDHRSDIQNCAIDVVFAVL